MHFRTGFPLLYGNLHTRWGDGIYTKVVANVGNNLDKTYVMVHDDECEKINAPLLALHFLRCPPPLDQKLNMAKTP